MYSTLIGIASLKNESGLDTDTEKDIWGRNYSINHLLFPLYEAHIVNSTFSTFPLYFCIILNYLRWRLSCILVMFVCVPCAKYIGIVLNVFLQKSIGKFN